jgi:eukaryotic-like serine/threonine-protein kinase
MAIAAGTRIGPYEVLSLLGAGGMGEVYRARDTTLHRDVAIKVLPDLFASDAERLARFTREAQTLAALNHPNIAHIHGLEANGGVRALVMELVEGEDLSQRLARGLVPLDEALPIAKQIAEALEAAHEQGIVHRDLKPANIKVRADGVVKVLDFGLAKALEPGTGSGDAGSANLANSPTITSPAMTMRGMILGTAAYMAPEQAKGKPVDKRADIWAFGCVLFEMLTGRRAFQGDDVSTTLAAVLLKEPDWQALPSSTSVSLRALLTRCLTKDPKRRLRDIGEAGLRIDELLAGVADSEALPVVAPAPPAWRRVVPWAAVGVLALGATVIATVVALRPTGDASPAPPVQFTIAPPENTSFGGPPGGGTGNAPHVAVSPDGQNVVFVARAQSTYQLWLRPIAALAARAIPGSEGGAFPFWSPDSRFIGFFADGKLKKVAIAGGPPVTLCDAPTGRGGSWNRDNVILFSPSGIGTELSGLLRVSSGGGVPTEATTIDPATGETHHRWPHFLPDGRHFLYTASTGTCCPPSKPAMVRIGSLDPNEATVTLFQAESSASYASGHLLFARDETLMAQPFDPNTRQPTGGAFPLAEHVATEGSRYVGASVSENGTLVYAHGGAQSALQLTWVDRAGRAIGTVGDAAPYVNLWLSPDESRVAVSMATGSPANVDIWIIDLARNIPLRLTFNPLTDGSPVWSPDGSRVAFESGQSGQASIRQRLVSGAAGDEPLLEGSPVPGSRMQNATPSDWSADGRFLAYTQRTSSTTSDVWVLPLFGDRKAFPLLQTEFVESSAVFSPNGRWIAYTTNEARQPNVYVQPFPGAGGKYQVSRDGGSHPVWRADGKELFYLGPDATLMAVPVDTTDQFDIGAPQALFPTAAPRFNTSRVFAVTKDGQRFLVSARPQQASGTPLTVVINWIAAIQQ